MRLRMSLLVAALSAGLAAPVCAAADTPSATASTPAPAAAAPPPKPKHKAPDPNQVICKDETPLGSHIGASRQCMTRAQWDDISRQTQQRLNDTAQRQDTVTLPSHM